MLGLVGLVALGVRVWPDGHGAGPGKKGCPPESQQSNTMSLVGRLRCQLIVGMCITAEMK